MYLVLGGTGLIGSNLVHRLSRKDNVRILARHQSDIALMNGVEMIVGDIKNVDMNRLLDNVHCVYHLISSSVPMNGIERLRQDIQDDYLPMLSLMDAMNAKNVAKLFFISSGGAIYGDYDSACNEKTLLKPKCTYALSKLYLEQCLSLYRRYSNVDSYILRVANPYGVDRKEKKQGIIPIFARNIMNGTPITIWGDGTNERDYILVDEVVDAMESVESYRGDKRVFNIGTGKSVSMIHIISLLCKELNQTANIQFLDARTCDVAKSVMDVRLIEQECGWKSKVSIRDGIKLFIKQWRELL